MRVRVGVTQASPYHIRPIDYKVNSYGRTVALSSRIATQTHKRAQLGAGEGVDHDRAVGAGDDRVQLQQPEALVHEQLARMGRKLG